MSADGDPPYTETKFPAMQRMAIKALSESYAETVHATLYAEADATALESRLEGAGQPTLTGTLISILARALAERPLINSVFADGMRRTFRSVDIGLAVAGSDGSLSVPVIRGADKLSVEEIDRVRRELADRARAKKLRQDDFGGAAVTLSNLGMFSAIRFGAPVIPLGQGALFVTGALYPAPNPKDLETPVSWLPISFGFDHRVYNGLPAAEFVQVVADNIRDDGHCQPKQ